MEIKEAIYVYLERVGMTLQQTTKNHPFNVRNSILFITYGLAIYFDWMYLINIAKTLNEYSDCTYSLISETTAAMNFAFVTWKMAEIFRYIDNLVDIVNTRLMNAKLKAIYTQSGEKVKKFAENANLGFVKVTPIGAILPIYLGCFVAYLTTDLGPDALELPYPAMWFPFDVKNPMGYTLAVAIQFIITFNNCFAVTSVLVIVIAPCMILISTAEDIKYGLRVLNKSARKNESEFKITQQFNQFIRFHSKTKQLANAFSELVQFVFFVYFAWSIGSICLTMFGITFQLQENGLDSTIFKTFISLILSFTLIFVACEFGHKLSNAFSEIDYTIDQIHWYKLPTKLWKMLPILMAVGQEPVRLRVFGATSCVRGDFQRVVNTGFSYFMVLQRFEN